MLVCASTVQMAPVRTPLPMIYCGAAAAPSAFRVESSPLFTVCFCSERLFRVYAQHPAPTVPLPARSRTKASSIRNMPRLVCQTTGAADGVVIDWERDRSPAIRAVSPRCDGLFVPLRPHFFFLVLPHAAVAVDVRPTRRTRDFRCSGDRPAYSVARRRRAGKSCVNPWGMLPCRLSIPCCP